MSSSGSGTDKSGYAGQWSPNSGATPFNAHAFLVSQLTGLMATAKLVQVQACTNKDEISPVGTVDVIPMVNLLDGQGNATKHGTVYKLPYFRLQAGKSGIILDPQKGDIGLAVFADRDISVVKRTKKISNPGSYRRFDMADGLYLGGFLNVTLTQYLRFKIDDDGNPVGFELVDPAGNTIISTADGMTLTDKNSNSVVMNNDGMTITDKNSNTIVMDSDGIKINGVLFDQSQNVSQVADLTTTGNTSLGGGSKKIVLDGDTVTGGHVVASSTKSKAT